MCFRGRTNRLIVTSLRLLSMMNSITSISLRRVNWLFRLVICKKLWLTSRRLFLLILMMDTLIIQEDRYMLSLRIMRKLLKTILEVLIYWKIRIRSIECIKREGIVLDIWRCMKDQLKTWRRHVKVRTMMLLVSIV
jgi:hypothetical protein